MSGHHHRDVEKRIDKTDGKTNPFNATEIYQELERERRQDPKKFKTDLVKANSELNKYGFPSISFTSESDSEKSTIGDSKNGLLQGGVVAASLSGVVEAINPNPATNMSAALPPSKFAEKSLQLFERLNSTNDLVLTTEELAAALQSHDYSPEEMQVITAMYNDRDAISGLNYEDANGGITRNDFMRFGEVAQQPKSPTTDEAEVKVVNDVFKTMGRVASQINSSSTQLFANGDDPLKSIRPEAIKQQSVGDCYFDAPLASLAASNPQMIKDMIQDNGDGTYTVTFPGAKDEPMTVTGPTYGELALYNSGSEYGTWANVLEKAYGKYCQQSLLRRSVFNLGGGNTPTEGANGGAMTFNANMLLTGSEVRMNITMFTGQQEMSKQLTEAFSSTPPKVVSAYIAPSLSDETIDGFPNAHAYSVLGFKPDGNGGGLVKVRNPWGGADNTTRGTIEVPLDVFMRNFTVVGAP